MVNLRVKLYHNRIFKVSILLFLISLFHVTTTYGQTGVPEHIPIVFGVQTIAPLEINASTGLLEEMTSSTEVSYSLMFSVDDTSIDAIEIIMGSTEGASDIFTETYDYADFTESSTTTYKRGNELKYCSTAEYYQEDLYYEVLLYNANGDCVYKGSGNSNN